MDKLKMHSPDMTQQNIEKIQALFPNCVTESRGANGELKLAIDFDQLKQELSNLIVEGPQERYQLNWPGKREALLTANTPIAKTLRPCREESVNFDTTENLFIEGDNLDALKMLQETYLGKVKMIYIDPPYNTGNDFIYDDDFSENSTEYLKRSNQSDNDGNNLVANKDSNGRFHSDWLTMIYPRLKLARNLLKDDGVIFVSIDDSEQVNLKKVCDEIFGADNFIEQFVWIKKTNPPNNVVIGSVHEYVLAYAKNKEKCELYLLPRSSESNSKYTNPDNDPRGEWTAGDLSAAAKGGRSTPSLMYQIKNPNTGELFDPPPSRMWIVPKEQMEKNINEGRIWWGKDGCGKPKYKRFLSEVRQGVSVSTLLNFCGNNGTASKELNALFDGEVVFETPKPTSLIDVLCSISTKYNDTVLDFFAGSSATPHSILKQNAKDNGGRKFIAVQLPELCDESSSAFKAGYKTIAEISKERIRRAGAKILEGECHIDWNKDVGFRVLKVDTSNMADVYYSPDQVTQGSLDLLVDNIKADRTDEDLLFQVLLDWGVDLTLPIRKETIQGKSVFFVDDDALVACFDLRINEALIKELATKEPLRVVFRDDGFESDAVKINAEQIFKQVSPHTEVKAI